VIDLHCHVLPGIDDGPATIEGSLELARDGLLHNVASDAHDHVHRPPVIAAELEAVGLGPLTQWLTEAVPRAILDGGEVPPRPEVVMREIQTPHPRRWLHLRR